MNAVKKEDAIIREIVAEDISSLLILYLNLHDDAESQQDDRLQALWQSILDDPSYHIFVAQVDGRLVSSVTLCVIKNLTRGLQPYALIENVVTLEPYRRRGIATALLHAAVSCAKSSGCYKVMLLTGSKKEDTLRFYERAGFNRNDKTAFIRWL